MSISTHSHFAEDIIEAATEIGSNLIIFPIDWSTHTYPKGWGKNVALELWEQAKCPSVVFVDRGFGVSSITQLELDPLAAFPGQNQQVYFPFIGNSDDLEGAVLLNYMASYPKMQVVIQVLEEVKEDSLSGKALDALESFPNVTVERGCANGALNVIAKGSQFGAKDLILISHALYKSDVGSDSIHYWLDNVCKSSYMIVKKPDEGVEAKGGKRVLNRSLSEVPIRPSSISSSLHLN